MKSVFYKLGFTPELFALVGLTCKAILYTAIAIAVFAPIAGALIYLGF